MRVWVVTGCSTGFGKEICISALARGDNVIATCRGNPQQRLADLIAKGATVLSLDVAANPHEIETFAKNAIAVHGHVDIVCNNAGYVQQGALEEARLVFGAIPEETLQQYQTLLFGPLNITRAFLPHMRQRKTGAIAMIGSRGARMTIPGCGVYTSAKAALAVAARTLAAELEPFNIKVTCIEPGDYRTAVFTAPTFSAKRLPEYEEVLSQTYEHLGPEFQQPGDPHKGAERIVDLMTGVGFAQGRKIPAIVSLGEDAYDVALDQLETLGKEAREWQEWSTGTDFD